jgi:hypothetical protein
MMPCAQDVEDIVLADAGCRLPTSQPALDDYDQTLVDAAPLGRREFPEPSDENDGNPGAPELIYPLNQALDVSTTVTLSWAASDETDSYNVYVGTTNPPTNLVGTTTETTFQVADLSSSTVYYWQIWAADSCPNLTGSAVRQFATGS